MEGIWFTRGEIWARGKLLRFEFLTSTFFLRFPRTTRSASLKLATLFFQPRCARYSFYDRLLKLGNTQAQLDSWKLVRVHPQFRVIALGIPVPPYRGNPLDPPFRSRFQVRWIDGWGAVGRAGGRVGRGILVGERADEMDEDDVVGDFEKAKEEQERTGEMPQPKLPGGKNRGERVREMVRNVVMLAETVRVGNRMGE